MTSTLRPQQEVDLQGAGTQVKFANVNEPGTYVSNWTGHLIRIPDEGIQPGRSPLIEIRGKEPMFVTKLCDDPFIPLSKARLIAADLDLNVNF
jgi:hypothetical protein